MSRFWHRPPRCSVVARARRGVALVAGLLAATGGMAQVGTVRVSDALSEPTYAVAPTGDFARLFVTERAGDIEILDLVTDTFNTVPFLTVLGVTGEGLQGLAFHPAYADNGYFYVYYFTSNPARTVVERYARDPSNPDLADPLSNQLILQIDQPSGNHNGGWIGFGPDGYLYLPLGDGGGQCDPDNNGQNTDTLLSAVLRLDVDGDDFPGDPDRNYAVPRDNPFVGVPGADEIWSFGLRNPFRSSFDRETGDFYIADVGQVTREEVNFQPAASSGGENWGWDLREGKIATPDNPPNCAGGPPPPGNVDPIYDYPRGTGTTQGRSVTGGYVYRGPETELVGQYFFGDFINERIWSFDAVTAANFVDRTAAFVPDAGSIESIVAFGEDGFGNLYIVDLNGELFRVVGPVGFVPCPDLLISNEQINVLDTREHCRNIVTGPDLLVTGSGDLRLRAGNRVAMANGTSVESGGQLAVELDAALTQMAP